jgi:hypothetical protein
LVAELVEDIATEKPFIWAQPLQKKVLLMALRLKMAIPLDFKLKSSFSGLRVKIVQLSQKSYFFMGGNFAVGAVIFIVITFFIIFQFSNAYENQWLT